MKQRTGGDKAFWTHRYLLGLVSEIDEVLREVGWKPHRNQPGLNDQRNLALELADLTKYVISLWQNNGFSAEDMLHYSLQKSLVLEAQWQSDFSPVPEGWPVVICDVDGTLGDYRTALADWLKAEHDLVLPADTSNSLLFDVDLGLPYPQYYPLKEEFEAAGGYGMLPPYTDTFILLEELRLGLDHLAIIVYTARPNGKYKHIWLDTWTWLQEHGIYPYQLHIGGEERLLMASHLLATGHQVLLLEDDPSIISRAISGRIKVVGKRHPYNEHLGTQAIGDDPILLDNLEDAALIGHLLEHLGGEHEHATS